MADAPVGQEFYFCDGAVAKNTKELKAHIKEMSKDSFLHHVNKERNDFYNWIKDCIDPKLAEKIKNLKSQASIVSKL